MAAAHTTKGKVINVTIMIMVIAVLYNAAESWRLQKMELEDQHPEMYMFVKSHNDMNSISARTIRRLQAIQPAAGR